MKIIGYWATGLTILLVLVVAFFMLLGPFILILSNKHDEYYNLGYAGTILDILIIPTFLGYLLSTDK